MSREQLQTLTEPMYYLLLAMLTPRHGYDAMQYISQLTDGRIRIGAGTMYTLLARFEKEKILEQIAEEGRRKIYRLTEKGEKLLEEEITRLHRLLADADQAKKEGASNENGG